MPRASHVITGAGAPSLRPEVSAVPESPMVRIASLAEAMPGSLKLCYGESDEPTPAFICQAADEAVRAGHTFYTHTAGTWELRQTIAEHVRALHDVERATDEVMSTVGATAAIFTAIRALVGPGDNAVILSPSYALFANAVTMAGGEVRQVPLSLEGERWVLDLERVAAAMDARTRVLVVNSPCNPTGWVASVAEQHALCELAARHGAMLLADEVYERLVYDGRPAAPSFLRLTDHRSRLIVANSVSKTYHMTGWRLGWALAPASVVRVMFQAVEFITSNPPAMVQQAAIVALRDGEAFVRERRARDAARRSMATNALAAMPGVTCTPPQGAFYCFFRVDGVSDSTAFALRLLENTGVALTPGAAFGPGGEGALRLCFAVRDDTLAEALSRVAHFLRSRRY